MANANKSMRSWRMLLAALSAGILLSVFGMAAQAQAAGAPVVQQDDAAGSGRDPMEVYGRIGAMPVGTLIGQWTIGGTNYTTVPATEFDQEEGVFALGVCVKVHLKEDGVTVRELDSEPDSDCNGDDDDDDDGGREFYGIVEAMPDSGLIGQWTISGGIYTVTAQTEIKQRFGTIAVRSCVEVELTADESAVRELQSKRNAYCNNDDDDDDDNDEGIGRGELYARLVSFPPDLIGIWQIGAISVTADANTEFDQRNGEFTVDEYVKVEFRILEDGTFLAREIKTINTRDDDDDDDRGKGRRSKAFGVIDVIPDGNIGIWRISGISYTVTISTELNDKRGPLTEGQTVKVEYRRDAEGNRIAREIKAMPERAGNPDGLQKLVGYVEDMPSDGFIGSWTIDGVNFVADENSEFEEECGILEVDAFVQVKYVVRDGVPVIVKLETHVPPGGGDDLHFGRIDRMDDGLAAAAGTPNWEIGGRSYVVTDATDLSSDLAVGSTAVVNSYTAADGTQVATSISSVTLDNTLYLPAAIK